MPNCPRCGNPCTEAEQHCARCGFKLEPQSHVDRPGAATPASQAPKTTPSLGQVHGYTLLRRLAIGRGIGTTYAVRKEPNTFLLERLELEVADSHRSLYVRAFQEESLFLRNIRHFELPVVVDTFVEGHQLGLVLDICPGELLLNHLYPAHQLSRWQDLGHLNPPSLIFMVRWARQLADILHLLHSQSPFPLAHRNLAPDTIVVTPANDLRLIDFGILRSFAAPYINGDQKLLLEPTPFMDTRKGINPRGVAADLYAYGRVLDFILTGAVPSSYDAPPQCLKGAGFAVSDPRYQLAHIVERCCTLDPGQRYTHIQEIILDLRSLSSVSAATQGEEIQCRACGLANRNSARFCALCAQPLWSAYPAESAISSSLAPIFQEETQRKILASFSQSSFAPFSRFQLREELDAVQADPGFDTLICLGGLPMVKRMPHQEQAAERVLRQMRGRALLADEVGLGKTIEAGIILKELLQRKLVDHVLILCPPQLLVQWQLELDEKFDETFLVMGLNIDTSLSWLCPRLIAPYQVIEERFQAEEMLRHNYDLVILDEAHYLNDPTNWKILQNIQNLRKKYFLLLSATPMHNDIRELYNIITLLRPGHFEDWESFVQRYLIEKRRVDKSEFEDDALVCRLLGAKVLEDDTRNSELAFFDDCLEDESRLRQVLAQAGIAESPEGIISVWKNAERVPVGIQNAVELRQTLQQVMVRNTRNVVAQTFRFPKRKAVRLELELLPKGKEFYSRFRAFYQKGLQKVRNRNLPYEMGELVERLTSSPAAFSEALTNRLRNNIRRQLGNEFLNGLERFAADYPPELVAPKLQAAFDQIRQCVASGQKVLIFSQFNQTTRYAFRQAPADLKDACLLYDEEYDLGKKGETLKEFLHAARGGALFCPSEISEGANLQRAQVMINLDLPWDPMKIEQRIGRIQRIGGHDEVLIINIILKGTLEEEILHILEQKIQMFETVIGQVEEIIGNLSKADDFRAMVSDLWMENKVESEEGELITPQERIERALGRARDLSSARQGENVLNQVLKEETRTSVFFQAAQHDDKGW